MVSSVALAKEDGEGGLFAISSELRMAGQLIWQRSGERRLPRRSGAKAGYKLSNGFKL